MMKRTIAITAMIALILPMLMGANVSSSSINEEPTDTTYGWNAAAVECLKAHKLEFANKKMVHLYSFLEEKGMNVKDVWTKDTSPFADPYGFGRAYVRGLYLYSKVLNESYTGEKYHEIYVELNLSNNDSSMIAVNFWRSFDESKSEVKQFIQKTKDLIIKKIEIRQDTILKR